MPRFNEPVSFTAFRSTLVAAMAPSVVTGVPNFSPPPIIKFADKEKREAQKEYQSALLRQIVHEYRKNPERQQTRKKKNEEKGLRGLYVAMREAKVHEKENLENNSNQNMVDTSGEDTDTLFNTIQRDLFLAPNQKNQMKIDDGKRRQLEVNTVL